MPKLGTILLLGVAVYAGMLVQQAILHKHGYTITFKGLGQPDQ